MVPDDGISDLDPDLDLLCQVADRGIHLLIPRGWSWFATELRPALEALSRRGAPDDRALLADLWFSLGDLYFILRAPETCVGALRTCLAFDPGHAEAWEDLVDNLDFLGEYEQAISALREARARGLWDPSLEWHERELAEDLRTGEPPTDDPRDPEVAGNELLAAGRFEQVLARFPADGSTLAARMRTRARGGLGDPRAEWEEWLARFRLPGPVALDEADRFYLTRETWRSCGFWRALHEARERLVLDNFERAEEDWEPPAVRSTPEDSAREYAEVCVAWIRRRMAAACADRPHRIRGAENEDREPAITTESTPPWPDEEHHP
jgi:tetratricopeptide (TPR) repeat protein